MLSEKKFDFLIKFLGIGIPGGFAILGIVYLVLFFNGKRLVKKYTHNKLVYVTDSFQQVLNPTFYVKSSGDTSKLIAFYREVEKTTDYPVFTFPIRMLAVNEPVFLINNASLNGYAKVVEVISIDTASFPYDIHRGYVYIKNVHLQPLDKKK